MIYEPTVILNPEVVHIAETARVDSFVKIEGGNGVEIGEYVHVASFSHLNVGGGTLYLDDYAGISSRCSLGSASPDWGYLDISAALPLAHPKRLYVTRVCCFAVLFMGCILLPGVTVGVGSIALPGSVITDDIPDWAIVRGNPARVVGERVLYESGDSLYVPKRRELYAEILQPNGEAARFAAEKAMFLATYPRLRGLD